MRLVTQIVSAVAFIVFGFFFCVLMAARFGLFGDPGDGDPGPPLEIWRNDHPIRLHVLFRLEY